MASPLVIRFQCQKCLVNETYVRISLLANVLHASFMQFIKLRYSYIWMGVKLMHNNVKIDNGDNFYVLHMIVGVLVHLHLILYINGNKVKKRTNIVLIHKWWVINGRNFQHWRASMAGGGREHFPKFKVDRGIKGKKGTGGDPYMPRWSPANTEVARHQAAVGPKINRYGCWTSALLR